VEFHRAWAQWVLGGWNGTCSASLLQSLLPALRRGRVQSGCDLWIAGALPCQAVTRASSSGSPGFPALQEGGHPVSWTSSRSELMGIHRVWEAFLSV